MTKMKRTEESKRVIASRDSCTDNRVGMKTQRQPFVGKDRLSIYIETTYYTAAEDRWSFQAMPFSFTGVNSPLRD